MQPDEASGSHGLVSRRPPGTSRRGNRPGASLCHVKTTRAGGIVEFDGTIVERHKSGDGRITAYLIRERNGRTLLCSADEVEEIEAGPNFGRGER